MRTNMEGEMKSKRIIGIAVTFILFALAMIMIIGVDTNWGKTTVKKLSLTSADGDVISALLYKPKSATPENPAPAVMYAHGGNDMLEQGSSYAVELARRGYVVITWDYTGAHNSDIATGTSETAPSKAAGAPTMGAETVYNTLKTYNFVDKSKIVAMGHSMGGQYTMAFSINNQEAVNLQVNLGMNFYGSAKNQDYNFNFVCIIGDADESTLVRSNNNVASIFQVEQIRRIFSGDYTSEANKVPAIEIGKKYYAKSTDGNTYSRTAYMPDSCHAYYLVTNDAVQTVIYAVTSNIGVGLDAGVNSYEDRGKISTVWQVKDIGYILMLAAAVAGMVVLANFLLDTQMFKGLKLSKIPALGIEKSNWMHWVFFGVLVVLPVVLFRPGIIASRTFLGIDISKLWLLGGTNNSYIAWQWTVSIGMIVVFIAYHFLWGKKHGGNLQSYGFRTTDDGRFSIGYIGKAFMFGLLTVGCGYLIFSLISAYTKQGMHIATFMLSTINTNRSLCILMYFLFQIPYFLTSSLALKSIGVAETEDTMKGTLKSILVGTICTVVGLLVLWLFFVLIVTQGKTVTDSTYFAKDRVYIYTIAILPLFIGMTIANALNITVAKKTNSIWAGLFTALLWGTWMLISCGGMTKYLY